jgi:hypothetical protein
MAALETLHSDGGPGKGLLAYAHEVSQSGVTHLSILHLLNAATIAMAS